MIAAAPKTTYHAGAWVQCEKCNRLQTVEGPQILQGALQGAGLAVWLECCDRLVAAMPTRPPQARPPPRDEVMSAIRQQLQLQELGKKVRARG
jgi:hypothetical protein